MGRNRTGAWTVYECLRLELPWLLKNGFIRKGIALSGILKWTDQRGNLAGEVGFKSTYNASGEASSIELKYVLKKDCERHKEYKYSISLVEQPSNLGKGSVLYFQCPTTGRKCKILYLGCGSNIFQSRTSYIPCLYYDCQMASKLSVFNTNYWRLDKHLDKIAEISKKGERRYLGKKTRNALRYNRLREKQAVMDKLRWCSKAMPLTLRKSFQVF